MFFSATIATSFVFFIHSNQSTRDTAKNEWKRKTSSQRFEYEKKVSCCQMNRMSWEEKCGEKKMRNDSINTLIWMESFRLLCHRKSRRKHWFATRNSAEIFRSVFFFAFRFCLVFSAKCIRLFDLIWNGNDRKSDDRNGINRWQSATFVIHRVALLLKLKWAEEVIKSWHTVKTSISSIVDQPYGWHEALSNCQSNWGSQFSSLLLHRKNVSSVSTLVLNDRAYVAVAALDL